MTMPSPVPPKPISETIRPDITHLPPITFWRRLARWMWKATTRLLVELLTDSQVTGLENIPRQGAALLVSNHLGDSDFILGIARTPRFPDLLVKAELRDFPVLGKLLDAYGVIWIHRGQPDRRAIRAALEALSEGRLISIAPEGRESLTGALEEGTQGAAYLALKSNVPIIPITFTGTENTRVLDNLKHMRRSRMSLTIGPAFRLPVHSNRKSTVEEGTQFIMETLARQLPPEYRGVYPINQESHVDSG